MEDADILEEETVVTIDFPDLANTNVRQIMQKLHLRDFALDASKAKGVLNDRFDFELNASHPVGTYLVFGDERTPKSPLRYVGQATQSFAAQIDSAVKADTVLVSPNNPEM